MEALVDLRDVEVDASLPVPERLRDLAARLGDPYRFAVGGVEVRVSFAGQVPLESAVARFLGVEDGMPAGGIVVEGGGPGRAA